MQKLFYGKLAIILFVFLILNFEDDDEHEEENDFKSHFARAEKSLTTRAMSRPRIIALLLALVTLAVYLPATRFEFTNYDDNDYVSANPQVQAGLTWASPVKTPWPRQRHRQRQS